MSGLEMEQNSSRSLSQSMSYESGSDGENSKGARSPRPSRNAHHRASAKPPLSQPAEDGAGRYHNRKRSLPPGLNSRSFSNSSDSSFEERNRKRSRSVDRSKRRRRGSRSPDDRGRGRDMYGTRGNRRTRSPSNSKDRSLVTRYRKSMTPALPSDSMDGQTHNNGSSKMPYAKDSDRGTGTSHWNGRMSGRENGFCKENFPGNRPVDQRLRSLSPFSKRLALTQVMNRNQ